SPSAFRRRQSNCTASYAAFRATAYPYTARSSGDISGRADCKVMAVLRHVFAHPFCAKRCVVRKQLGPCVGAFLSRVLPSLRGAATKQAARVKLIHYEGIRFGKSAEKPNMYPWLSYAKLPNFRRRRWRT